MLAKRRAERGLRNPLHWRRSFEEAIRKALNHFGISWKFACENSTYAYTFRGTLILGPATVYAAACIGIAISFWALSNDTHATPAISGALGSVGVGQCLMAHLHVVRIVHDALYHVLQHCVAWKYRIHLWAAVLFLRVQIRIRIKCELSTGCHSPSTHGWGVAVPDTFSASDTSRLLAAYSRVRFAQLSYLRVHLS